MCHHVLVSIDQKYAHGSAINKINHDNSNILVNDGMLRYFLTISSLLKRGGGFNLFNAGQAYSTILWPRKAIRGGFSRACLVSIATYILFFFISSELWV